MTCTHCGQPIPAWSTVKGYCSWACRERKRHAALSPERRGPTTTLPPPRTCTECGAEYRPAKPWVRPKVTCGRACYRARINRVKQHRRATKGRERERKVVKPEDGEGSARIAPMFSLGPDEPLLGPTERETEAKRRRLREAIADGVPYSALLERFSSREVDDEMAQLRAGRRDTRLPMGIPS